MMTSKSADAGDGDWPCANIASTIAKNAATQRKISFIIERRYRTLILAQKSMDPNGCAVRCPQQTFGLSPSPRTARATRVGVSSVAASLLEWIINRQRIGPHETVRAVCASVAASKESFHIIHGRAAAS